MKTFAQFSFVKAIAATLSKPQITLGEKDGIPFILLDHRNKRYQICDSGVAHQSDRSKPLAHYSPLSRQDLNRVLAMASAFIESNKEKFPALYETVQRNARFSQIRKSQMR